MLTSRPISRNGDGMPRFGGTKTPGRGLQNENAIRNAPMTLGKGKGNIPQTPFQPKLTSQSNIYLYYGAAIINLYPRKREMVLRQARGKHPFNLTQYPDHFSTKRRFRIAPFRFKTKRHSRETYPRLQTLLRGPVRLASTYGCLDIPRNSRHR